MHRIIIAVEEPPAETGKQSVAVPVPWYRVVPNGDERHSGGKGEPNPGGKTLHNAIKGAMGEEDATRGAGKEL